MTVQTGEPFLKMDVWGQLVQFNAIGPDKRFSGSVRGSIFPIIIMFIAPCKVITNMVAIMTAQALALAGADKGMAVELAVGELEMTGSASCATPDIRIVITCSVNMAAKTLSAQHVIDEFIRGGGALVEWYFCQVGQWCDDAEIITGCIDDGPQSKMA